MGAEEIFRIRFSVQAAGERSIVVYMDLFRLPEGADPTYPERFKFSWIAYDEERPKDRILMDCHPPKGPHVHVDDEQPGTPFSWNGVESARETFKDLVYQRFGISIGGQE